MLSYSRLYDSTVSYYRRWYSEKWKLHTMAVGALSMCTFFNLAAVSNFMWIVGLKKGSWLSLDDRDGRLYLFAIMMLSIFINVALFQWRNRGDQLSIVDAVVPLPKMTPPIFLIGSFLFFIGSLFGALATVRSP